MKFILYFLKHLFKYLQVDVLLFKSIGIRGKIFFILFLILIPCVFYFFKLKYSNVITIPIKEVQTAQNCVYWIVFVYFFKFLKKQHFFHHFILNRTFFYVECEMFSFLLSICIIVFALNTVLFLNIFNTNCILFSFATIISSIVDALLFSIWKVWKYFLFEILLIIISILLTSLVELRTLIDFYQNSLNGGLVKLYLNNLNIVYSNVTTVFCCIADFLVASKILKKYNKSF